MAIRVTLSLRNFFIKRTFLSSQSQPNEQSCSLWIFRHPASEEDCPRAAEACTHSGYLGLPPQKPELVDSPGTGRVREH
jgi:hypothetical protein